MIKFRHILIKIILKNAVGIKPAAFLDDYLTIDWQRVQHKAYIFTVKKVKQTFYNKIDINIYEIL